VKARVLIVEDEPVLASGIRRLLLLDGFEIAGCVGSVKMALAIVNEVDCDIALLDVNLRGESGVAVAEALRRRGCPFVLMSGYDHSDLPAAFGDVPFLPKPFDANQLVAMVRQMIERSNAA
jgi:DNA-binding response OmpR family regulator